MRFYFSTISKFKTLPLGTIAEVTIYFGEGTYDYNQVNVKKINENEWEFIENKYGYKGTKDDNFVITNQHKYYPKNMFYLSIPSTRFDMHPMYLIRGNDTVYLS